MKSSTAFYSFSFAILGSALGLAADPVENKVPATPLAPLAFFTTHEWTAKLPEGPDGR
jgi:hypothetical protein